MKLFNLIFVTLLLSGCASIYNPIPEGYMGETVSISDSYSNKENTTAHYFILNKIDDKQINTSWGQTRENNYGQGFHFIPSILTHKVLPKNQSFQIQGLIFFSTDAQALFGNNLYVEGTFNFAPVINEAYTIKGVLNKIESKIWMEDTKGNKVTDVFIKNHK